MSFMSTVFALLSLLTMTSTQVIHGVTKNAARDVDTAIAVTISDSNTIHGVVVPRQERETVTVTITTVPAYCQSRAPTSNDSVSTVLTGESSVSPQAPETSLASSTDNLMTTGASTLAGQIHGSVGITVTSTTNPTASAAASENGSTASLSITQSASVTSNTMPMSTPPTSGGSMPRRPVAGAAGGLIIISLVILILAG